MTISMKKALILLTFLTLVACSNKQVLLGKKCLEEVNGNETITTKSYIDKSIEETQSRIDETTIGKTLNSLT